MNRIKRKFPYVLTAIICSLCLIGMVFAYVVQVSPGYSLGVTGYQLTDISGIGFWYVLLKILHCFFVMFLVIALCISILEILNDAKIIKFEVTFRKVTSFVLVKALLVVLALIAFLELLLVWFTILANGDYGFVFGAGAFINLFILIFGFIIFVYMQRNYFDKWQELPDKRRSTIVEVTAENNQEQENEVVVDSEE